LQTSNFPNSIKVEKMFKKKLNFLQFTQFILSLYLDVLPFPIV
jgi:hypothetical protein